MMIADVLAKRGRHFDCLPETTHLSAAIALMHNKVIGSVGVMAGHIMVPAGLLSHAEVVGALARFGAAALTMPIHHFMRTPVVTCGCDDTLASVMQVMTQARTRHVVVMTADGRMAGLVSLGDLVAAQLADAQLESGVLRDLARSRLLAGGQ